MNSKKMKSFISLTLAAFMAFSLSGCGENTDNTNTTKPQSTSNSVSVGEKPVEVATEMDPDGTYFKTGYVDFKLKDMNPEFYNVKPAGDDSIIFTAYDNDYMKCALCVYNLKDNTVKTIVETVSDYSDPLSPTSNMDSFTADKEGNIYVYMTGSQLDTDNIPPEKLDYSKYTKDDVIRLMTGWGQTASQAEKDLERGIKEGWYKNYMNESGEMDWGRYYVSNTSYDLPHIDYKKLQKYDKSGELIYEVSDFNILGDNANSAESNSYISSMTATADGRLVFAVETYFWGMPAVRDGEAGEDAIYDDFMSNEQHKFVVVSKDGAVEKEIPWEGNYINGVYTLNDGSIGISYYDNEKNDGMGGYALSVLDLDKGSAEAKFEIPFDYFDKFVGLSGDDYLLGYNSKMYKVNVATGEKEEYINWLDCDINGNNVQTVLPLSDGRYFAATSFYDYAKQESGYESVYLTQIPFSEVPKKEYINLVCTYTDDMMAQYVIKYNKSSDKYRIRITPFEYDYNSEVDYTDQLNSFMTAMVSDNSIDIIVSDDTSVYSTMSNLSRKGLLVDLSQYMTGSVKKDDFIPSVLKAFSQGDKVFALPVSVNPYVLAGRADMVGDKPNWSLDDALAAVKKRGSDVQILAYTSRSDVLNSMISLNYQSFIDENNKCHFDNGDLEKILEFSKEFPEEINYENYTDEMNLLRDKKLMLIGTALNDMSQIQLYESVTGAKFAFVGYPSTTGNGAMLSFGNMLAITKNCKAPDEAWKFIEQYFSGDVGAYNYYGGYPTVKKQFETTIAKRLEEQSNGGYSYGYNDFMVEVKPLTKEDMDFIKDMIYNSTGISNAVSNDVLGIILEEAGAYFSDQKSVDEVVNIIQSRVSIKLSEQE